MLKAISRDKLKQKIDRKDGFLFFETLPRCDLSQSGNDRKLAAKSKRRTPIPET